MTLKMKITIAWAALLLSLLACATLFGGGDEYYDDGYSNDESGYYDDEPQTDTQQSDDSSSQNTGSTEAQACPVITDQIISLAQSGGADVEENLLDGDVYMVTYTVNGNEISDPYFEDVSSDLQDEQDDEAKHQEIWNYFSTLIPLNQRDSLTEYSIVTDGQGGSLAAVAQTQTDFDKWSLEVDIIDSNNSYDLTYTLVHEFAHLLTLGPDQVDPSLAIFNNPEDNDIYLQEASRCADYFPGEGCARSDSYINNYFNQFWADIHEEWNEINLIEDEDALYEALDNFYYKYEDSFVTSYAPTNPEEDIAESFSFFVFSPRPEGNTIVEEKILFFYDYPELVQLRANILNNMCVAFPQ